MKNYSRQREKILNVLRSTNQHPTANWVYEKVREEMPNISLGTVYRNLSDLQKSGEILCIDVGDGFDHFDGDNSDHVHLHCKNCGKITDLELESNELKNLAKKNNFTPESIVCIIYGICDECNKSKTKQEEKL